MDRKLSNISEVREHLRKMSPDELSYTLGRYCGPHNVLLAEKQFGGVAKHLMRLVNEEMANRTVDEFLLSDTE